LTDDLNKLFGRISVPEEYRFWKNTCSGPVLEDYPFGKNILSGKISLSEKYQAQMA